MNRLLTIITAVLLALQVSAQKYDALWKQVDKAREAGKPVTCLKTLKVIEKKAEKEGQYGQLMAALFTELGQQYEISDDSLKSAVARLNAQDSLGFKKDNLALWIYWIAKNKYTDNNSKAKLTCPSFLNQYIGFPSDKFYPATAKQSLVAYLLQIHEANPQNIGSLTADASAMKYVPLIKKEAGSKYFNNDLISVIATELEDYKPLIGWYSKHGNRPAACLAAAKYIETLRNDAYEKDKYPRIIATTDSLINVFADLKECGALAVAKLQIMDREDNSEKVKNTIAWIDEATKKWPSWQGINALKNKRLELTNPKYEQHGKNSSMSTAEQKLYFRNVRNIGEFTVTATPLNFGTEKFMNLVRGMTFDGDENIEKLKMFMQKDRAITVTKKCEAHKDYEYFEDSLSLGKLPLGFWFLETKCDGKTLEEAPELLAISDLKIMSLALSENKIRYVVVNAQTGQPVRGAQIHLLYKKDDNYEERNVINADENGEYIFKGTEKPYTIYATTETDKSQLPDRVYSYFSRKYSQEGTDIHYEIFTDRSIYRPGQTVKVSVLAYNMINDKETKVAADTNVELTFKDANYKTIGTDTIKTDAFGVATTEFHIPEGGLNGRYHINTKRGSESIRVEEYVRPTFEVTIAEPKTAYKAGDTISVTGTAKTYSGVPVSDSRVAYKVARRGCWWWHTFADYNILLEDTVYTDKAGNFTMKMPMLMEEENSNSWMPRFYTIEANAQVTDLAGESHSAKISLSVGNKESILTSDMNDKMLADSVKAVTFTRRNMNGTEIKGTVAVTIDGKEMPSVETGKKMTIPTDIASGTHKLVAICGNDTLEQTFVVFRKTDTRPALDTNEWWYEEGKTFSEDNKDVAWVQFGSARKIHVVYTLYSGDNVLENGTMELDSAVTTKEFRYKEEYGDGICFTLAWVYDGKLYNRVITLTKALPDKTLNLKWETFRNKLLPGQKEEWRMSITDNEGKPANANLMAVLYDKSLDAILKHEWSFSDNRWISQPFYIWQMKAFYADVSFGRAEVKYLDVKDLLFSHFDDKYFNLGSGRDEVLLRSTPRITKMSNKKMYSSARPEAMAIGAKPAAAVGANESKVFDCVDQGPLRVPEEESTGEDIQIRENLSELAFFQPQIRTDENGIATIAFTLPESVTTWKFMGFANDKDMRFGLMTDEVIAQKKLMVQPHLPRFLRLGDTVELPTTISNLSEKDIKAKVRLTLLDAETEEVLATATNKVNIKAGETVSTSFPVDSRKYEDQVFICRITAEGNGFSDGEQEYLPVLSDKELVLDTYSYIINKGETTLHIDSLMPKSVKEGKMTVEYTDSPEWLMVQALPYITNVTDCNALSLVGAYYANSVASYIANSCPTIQMVIKDWGKVQGSLQSALTKNEDLRQTLLNETPWVGDADSETESMNKLYNLFDKNQLNYRNTNILNRLSELQNSDGSFSWWKGMSGSNFMTIAVVETLMRMTMSTGITSDGSKILSRGLTYLDTEIARQLDEIKKLKQKNKKYVPSITGFQLEYLYTLALYSNKKISGKSMTNRNYLLNYVLPTSKIDDIQSKAMLAIVYAKAGAKYQNKAKDLLESIRQHTVYRQDIGRYFDSFRAGYSWFDYRIPTQVSVIEALKAVEPDDTKTISEMQRWLLQSKRTQSWDTPINAVNAIYAFFGNKPQLNDRSKVQGPSVNIEGSKTKAYKLQGEVSGLGYGKLTEDITSKDKSLTVVKTTDGESWMNVYVQTLQPATDIEALSNGISITRTYSNEDFKVGDKVTVTLTIIADRDYDFVTVTDKRPACLEPVNQLSGYRNGCYQVMRDSQSQYHFNMLSKGTHTIKTEYYVTQEGTFSTGTATVQCAYATEFTGHTGGTKMEIRK